MPPPTAVRPPDPLAVAGITTQLRAINLARHSRGEGRLWVADLSQIWGGSSWLYFAYVLDHGSGRCLGWVPHRVPHARLVTDALRQAVSTASPRRGGGAPEHSEFPFPSLNSRTHSNVALVFGRGCRTAEVDFPRWAIPSASDVALCDGFVAAIRALVDEEEHDERAWASFPQAKRAIAAWIEATYNPRVARRSLAEVALA